MLRAEVVQAHIPPRTVQDVLGDSSVAGFSQRSPLSYAWALQRQSLLVWKVEDGLNATVRRLPLSEPTSGRVFVEVIPHSDSAAVTVVLCTGSGQFYVWLDANYPVTTYHAVLAVSANSNTAADLVICGLSASPANGEASLGFVAVVATADGALHLYHGSQSGIFPRQFYKPTSAAAPRAGMLGALGSVVKALYSEAFDPLHNLQRASASAMAALQLHLLQLDGNRWKLLVLTADALDCWLLGTVSGHNSTEQLLWSFNLHGVLSDSLQAKELALLAFAISDDSTSYQVMQPSGDQVVHKRRLLYVWSAFLGATSFRHTHVLSSFALEEGNAIPQLLQSTCVDKVKLPEPDSSSPQLRQWQMVAHPGYSSCLLLAPDGNIMEWLAGGGANAGPPQSLGSSFGNLAISCTAGFGSGSCQVASNWQLLNASYGVLEFLAQCPLTADIQTVQQRPATAWTLEQEAAAIDLVNKTVELMYKEYLANCPYTELAEGLSDRLARLGVFEADQGLEALVLASRDLVGKMPKAGSGGFSSGSLMDLLSQKGARHDILLAAYKAGGVMAKLPAREMRTVFEHAELLAAAAAVLNWQRRTEAECGQAGSGVTKEQTFAAAAVIEAAGLAAAEGIEAGSALQQHWEVFFSRPTVSMPALFEAAADEAAALSHALQAAADDGSAHLALQQLLGLSGVLQAAVLGADTKAGQLSASMPEEVRYHRTAGPSWLASDSVRSAWLHIAEACLLVRQLLADPAERLQLARSVHLPALQHLLSGMRDVISRSRTPPAATLKENYAAVAAQHGASLLNDAAEELQELRSTGLFDGSASGDETSQGPAVASQALIWPLEQIAQHHGAHELLYNVCELLLTTGLMNRQRLLGWMQQEVQQAGAALPPDSFTYFVMERWRCTGQLSLLMQLGRQGFQQQLQQFLAGYPSLLWMSQVQASMLQQAAATLDKAADIEQASASNRRRLLCLAKLAAHASGNNPNRQQLTAKAATRLRQLSLQQQHQPGIDTPLSTAQFAMQALSDQELSGVDAAEAAVAAVEALALEPEQSHTDQYRELWNRSWQSVLAHTPLTDLTAAQAALRAAGRQPEEFAESVRQSPLYLALVRAAAALVDARQAQVNVTPHQVLDSTCNALFAEVQQRNPSAADCVQHILSEAVKTVEPLLASA